MNITKALNFNVKRAKTGARHVLQRNHTIPVFVRKYYTDVNGIIIPKATAPVELQTRFPIFLLSEMDRQGGYSIGRRVIAPDNGTFYLQTFVNGMGNTSNNIIGVSGLNEIQGKMNFGDIVIVYSDSLNAPSCYVWFVISSIPVSMASILANSLSTQNDNRLGRLNVYEINLMVSHDSQLSEDLHITRTNNLGTYTDDQIQPLGIYRSIMDKQSNLVRLKLIFDIDQFLGINFYMLYACDTLTFNFNIQKNG